MQSQYGLPEMQQFMAEGGCSSLFTISAAEVHHRPHSLNHHHYPQQMHPLPPPPSLHHYHSSPTTQQLFHNDHQFHIFQQEQQRRIHQQLVQLGLEQETPFINGVDFKLGVNDTLREREDILQVDDEEEPFWRPLDIEYSNRNSKRSKEKQQNTDSACNFKLFSELEAICKPISNGESFHQTGSGSVLTGDNPPAISATPRTDYALNNGTLDQGSDSSTGEEAAQVERPMKKDVSRGSRKRKRRQQLSSIAAFIEGLVKRMMEHQEGLHRKFLEILDRRDHERMSREEKWRQQELAKANNEALAKAQEQALASSREAAIVFFLEKMTGESLNLPTREQFHSPAQDEESKLVAVNPSRWPKPEVQALIQVRSSLEARFQEPGLKGPLWEEVSLAMAAMGYQRSAKRCKEKWENINKYFRKTKDSVKKRSHHSKTCPYFHQLDQLYSKSPAKLLPAAGGGAREEGADMSEFLQAVMADKGETHEQMQEDNQDYDEDDDDEEEDEGESLQGDKGLSS